MKEKYDGIARMWKSLPTDAELLQRQSLTAEQLVRGEGEGERGEEGIRVGRREGG